MFPQSYTIRKAISPFLSDRERLHCIRVFLIWIYKLNCVIKIYSETKDKELQSQQVHLNKLLPLKKENLCTANKNLWSYIVSIIDKFHCTML